MSRREREKCDNCGGRAGDGIRTRIRRGDPSYVSDIGYEREGEGRDGGSRPRRGGLIKGCA